jgi:hypothetical protein
MMTEPSANALTETVPPPSSKLEPARGHRLSARSRDDEVGAAARRGEARLGQQPVDLPPAPRGLP